MKSSVDWRYPLLSCLALLLIAGGTLRYYPRTTIVPTHSSNAAKSWQALTLRWEAGNGGLAQGIYHRDGEKSWSANQFDRGDAGESSGEPRLAVFVHQPLDLNRIDFDTLRILRGVGPKMAAAIIDHRGKHGPFRRVEDLLAVKGVGPAKLKLLGPSLTVGSLEKS